MDPWSDEALLGDGEILEEGTSAPNSRTTLPGRGPCLASLRFPLFNIIKGRLGVGGSRTTPTHLRPSLPRIPPKYVRIPCGSPTDPAWIPPGSRQHPTRRPHYPRPKPPISWQRQHVLAPHMRVSHDAMFIVRRLFFISILLPFADKRRQNAAAHSLERILLKTKNWGRVGKTLGRFRPRLIQTGAEPTQTFVRRVSVGPTSPLSESVASRRAPVVW